MNMIIWLMLSNADVIKYDIIIVFDSISNVVSEIE